MNTVLQLFLTFLRIGAFTFGGGYAMIPLIQKEIVENKKWISNDDVLEIIAIAESTPGPFAVNASTFVGYKVCGFRGAFFGTLGVVLPSFAVIMAVSTILREFQSVPVVRYAFWGIRAGVVALLIKTLWSMYRQIQKGALSYIAMAAAFVLAAFVNIHIVIVIIGCGAFGLVMSILAERRQT